MTGHKSTKSHPEANSSDASASNSQESSASENTTEQSAETLSASEVSTTTASALEEISKQQAEVTRYKDLALRAQADFDNYRKRAAKEKEDAIRYANTSLLEKLLPILDNFELGLVAARQASENSGKNHNSDLNSALLNGMSMVQKQIEDFLKDHGVQAIEAVGQVFDPHSHEALGHEPTHDVPEGHVAKQLRRGYKIKDRLLRPSNVFVASKPTS